MLWLAEEILAGRHRRVDIPAPARAVHNGLLEKRLEEDLCSIFCHVPPMTQSVKGMNSTESSIGVSKMLYKGQSHNFRSLSSCVPNMCKAV